jgi:hypothetical protein
LVVSLFSPHFPFFFLAFDVAALVSDFVVYPVSVVTEGLGVGAGVMAFVVSSAPVSTGGFC